MAIYLGDLTVADIEKEHNFTFTQEERDYLNAHHHAAASFEDRKSGWHLFEIPARFEISPDEVGSKILEIILEHRKDFTSPVAVAYAWEEE